VVMSGVASTGVMKTGLGREHWALGAHSCAYHVTELVDSAQCRESRVDSSVIVQYWPTGQTRQSPTATLLVNVQVVVCPGWAGDTALSM
jgi:hypothetical protein